jgi:hypothetical protein
MHSIENVGFELRLCAPIAACSNINEIDVLHHILIKQTARMCCGSLSEPLNQKTTRTRRCGSLCEP